MPRYPLAGGGITRLSELTIDANKAWLLNALTRVGGLDVNQVRGDIWMFDFENGADLIVRRLQAPEMGKILCSRGPLKPPFWAWGWEEPGLAGSLERYYAALITLTRNEDIVPVDQSHNETAPMTSEHEQAYGDAPADYIKRLTPAILCPDAQAIVAAAQTYNRNAAVATLGGGHLLIDGAVADDGGAQVDETAVARSAAANDMTLLPGLPVAGDAYYFGCTRTWDILRLNVGQAGAGTWTFHYEYWNGAWVALPGVVDNTDRFRNAGINELRFTRPGDWAVHIVQAMNLFWIRCRVNVFTAITVQPLGTQAWCEVTA